MVGLFIRIVIERKRRQTFIATRVEIAAKLEMQDENEKIVRFYSLGDYKDISEIVK